MLPSEVTPKPQLASSTQREMASAELTAGQIMALKESIRRWGQELGFQQIGFTGIDLQEDEVHLQAWLQRNFQGRMDYMARHGTRRSRPAELLPGTVAVISGRMDYLPPNADNADAVLTASDLGYVSRYALGRDYHKVLRKRLQRLATRIQTQVGEFGYRAFVDSAPVLEKALARNSGLGWIGKHTNLLNRNAGSWFFLGEIYTDLPLPPDEASAQNFCGSCVACLEVCPTQAIVAPYQVDARRCISYHTIELREAIPEEFRRAIGNRIYGCDDCQLVCPWNKYAKLSAESDFAVRDGLDKKTLVELFAWSESDFEHHTAGSAIRRIGYLCWLRNVAVGLGNAPSSPAVLQALASRRNHESELVREHVAWAIAEHAARQP